MDRQKGCKIPQYGKLPMDPGERILVGARQIRKALDKGRARKVFLARNADPSMTEPLEALCREKGVSCVWVSDVAELGRACGIDVGAAAAALIQSDSTGLDP